MTATSARAIEIFTEAVQLPLGERGDERRRHDARGRGRGRQPPAGLVLAGDLRARAIENQLYVLACSAVGSQADVEMAGHSLVIDPWGEIVAEGGDGEQIVYAEIDPALVPGTRERFPVLKDRRL